MVFPPATFSEILNTAATWRETAGPDESLFILMGCLPPQCEPTIILVPFFNGSAKVAKEKFAPFYAFNPIQDLTKEMPYVELNSLFNSLPTVQPGGRKSVKGCLFSSIDPSTFQTIFDKYVEFVKQYPEAIHSAVAMELHSYKKIMERSNMDTAFGNRGEWYQANILLQWNDAGLDAKVRCSSFCPSIGLESNSSILYSSLSGHSRKLIFSAQRRERRVFPMQALTATSLLEISTVIRGISLVTIIRVYSS
jgi:hypothetical protein